MIVRDPQSAFHFISVLSAVHHMTQGLGEPNRWKRALSSSRLVQEERLGLSALVARISVPNLMASTLRFTLYISVSSDYAVVRVPPAGSTSEDGITETPKMGNVVK